MRGFTIDDRVDRAAEYQLRRGADILDGMSTELRKYLASNTSDGCKPKYPVPPIATRALSSESWHEHKYKWRPEPEATRAAWPKISFSGRSEERQASRLRNYVDTKYWTNPLVDAYRTTTIHHTEVSPAVFAESNRERIRRLLRHREMDASMVTNNKPTRRSIERSIGRELSQTVQSILNTSCRSRSKSTVSKTRSALNKSAVSKNGSKKQKTVNFHKKPTISTKNKILSPNKQDKVAATKLLNTIKRLNTLLVDNSKRAWC